MNWISENEIEIAEKIRDAGNHVIVVPAQNSSAPLDTVDIFDGSTHNFIATDVPEKPAREYAVIWNNLLDSGEPVEKIKQINIAWLTGVTGNRKVYSR